MTDITTWIDEYHKGSRFGLNGKILIKKTSKYQEIIVIENKYYGKALMLDGCWMTSLKDEKYYHECLVHPALSSIDEKSNVLIIGGGDGGTVRECVKYSQISKIDLVEIDEEVIKISKKFLKEIGGEAWNDKRLEIHIDDGVKWVKKTNQIFLSVKVDIRNGRIIILSVIDNLLKGQSGQAIQNLNIMSGFSMDDGLELTNNYP